MCTLCDSDNIENVYTPIKSKIDLSINICTNCGHVFASYDQIKFDDENSSQRSGKIKKLSCEADYSEIRVGKQQMVNYFFDAYEQLSNKFHIQKVLDFKSARGDFALKALDYFNLSSIDCIEEDVYMTESYKDNHKINISYKKYYESFVDNAYDLIYSCHSLEHYRDPKNVLLNIRQKLKNDGLFYIDVPNIETIDNKINIDDFFYDKHLHYFTSDLLVKIIENLGFKLLIDNTSHNNIGLLFQKVDSINSVELPNYYEVNKKKINKYKKNLANNRKKIRQNINFINDMFDIHENNAIIGCGRALDAMIKYGNLDISKFNYFVDDFLVKATDSIYDNLLLSTEQLENIDGALLLVKTPSQKILNKLKDAKILVTYDEILK